MLLIKIILSSLVSSFSYGLVTAQVYDAHNQKIGAAWKWASFYLKNNTSIGFRNNSNLILGVLNPINGISPRSSTWHYPEKEGLYFFNAISAVGSKWKNPIEFGPDAQPNIIDGSLLGSISLFINWNHPTTKTELYNIEIE
jgi:hypothetical protein